jgi:hypothetical protein
MLFKLYNTLYDLNVQNITFNKNLNFEQFILKDNLKEDLINIEKYLNYFVDHYSQKTQRKDLKSYTNAKQLGNNDK